MQSIFKTSSSSLRIGVQSLVFTVFTGLSGIGSAAEILNFGLYTSDKPSEMIRQFRPIIDELEKSVSSKLGKDIEIRIQVANSYELGVERLVRGDVDFARLGPASYVAATQQNPGLRIIAMEQKKGLKHFNGVICVAKDSAITSVAVSYTHLTLPTNREV